MSHPPQANPVPATPSVQATDISDLFVVNESDLKGTGAFSRVVTAVNRNDKQLRALKVMQREGLVGKKAQMVLHEKEILRRTNHPAIVKLHSFVQTSKSVFFELDLMRTDLFEEVVKVKRFSEEDTALIMKQLLSAVQYLHDTDIVHRDIKPENILINSPSDIKLADFGLAKVIQGWLVRSTPCGTSYYIAPEVINSIESQGSQPLTTTKEAIKFVDIWSCGVVMYVILAGRPPFSGQVKTSEDRRQLLRRISRGVLFPDDKWKNISDHAKDLILRLLSIEVTGRITAKEALDHPFFGSKREASMVIDDIGADYVDVKQELEQIQQGIIDEGDAEGDVSSFKGETTVKASHGTTKTVKQKKFSAPI